MKMRNCYNGNNLIYCYISRRSIRQYNRKKKEIRKEKKEKKNKHLGSSGWNTATQNVRMVKNYWQQFYLTVIYVFFLQQEKKSLFRLGKHESLLGWGMLLPKVSLVFFFVFRDLKLDWTFSHQHRWYVCVCVRGVVFFFRNGVTQGLKSFTTVIWMNFFQSLLLAIRTLE